MALPKRSEVPVNETWDLTAIYPDKKAWKADMVAVRELVTQFQNNYRSKLTEAKIIIAALHDLETIYQKLSWIEHYAFLPQTTDMTNPEYNQMLVENDNLHKLQKLNLNLLLLFVIGKLKNHINYHQK